jgi:hypothetical protein
VTRAEKENPRGCDRKVVEKEGIATRQRLESCLERFSGCTTKTSLKALERSSHREADYLAARRPSLFQLPISGSINLGEEKF